MNRLRKRQFRFSAFYLLTALLALYIFQVFIATPQTRKVSYTDFVAEVRAGHLAEVNITAAELIGLLKEDAVKQKQARLISATRLPGIDESPSIATYYMLVFGARVERVLGDTGIRIFMRLMGLVLSAMAVQFALNGISDVWPGEADKHR